MKNILFSFISIVIGFVCACVAIYGIAVAPIQFPQVVYKTLGIKKPEIVGFLPYWLVDKATSPYEKFLTSVSYYGLEVSGDGSVQFLAKPGEEEPGWAMQRSDKLYNFMSKLEKGNVSRSLLVQTVDADTIEAIMSSPAVHAANLVRDVVPVMKKYGYTDLNVDIESFDSASISAQQAYTDFIKTVKSELNKLHAATVTVDIPVKSLYWPLREDPVELGKIADRIVLMAYDYSYLGSYVSGPVAPIGGAPEVREMDVRNTLKTAIAQIPKEKILLGIPLYGYAWETISDKPQSPTIPRGGSTASTSRVIDILKSCINCTQFIDSVAEEPYVVQAEGAYFKQIFYEDSRSLSKKVELAREFDIAGVALWAIGYEPDGMLESLADYKKSFRFAW